ncbi:hypothetical protein PHLCEN_2v1324, partial [Hermanssonia centrifuga]
VSYPSPPYTPRSMSIAKLFAVPSTGVSIDESHLALYPEDGVPMEIEDIIWHTTDTGLVNKENVGYVPDEDGELDNAPIGDSEHFQGSSHMDVVASKLSA